MPTREMRAVGDVPGALRGWRKERRFARDDYARFHPEASLGLRLLLRVSDLMRTGDLVQSVPARYDDPGYAPGDHPGARDAPSSWTSERLSGGLSPMATCADCCWTIQILASAAGGRVMNRFATTTITFDRVLRAELSR